MKMNTKVKCDVESCKHNDCDCCNLDTLDISSICKGNDCFNKTETICKSFSRKK